MPFPLAVPFLIALAGAGGESGEVRPPIAPSAITSSVSGAAEQIKRCYRSPRISASARQIITRLHVRYAIDGMLADLPTVVSQAGVTPQNLPFADEMAEAAILAVIRCAPLRLPPEQYEGGWDEFELTFSPRVAV